LPIEKRSSALSLPDASIRSKLASAALLAGGGAEAESDVVIGYLLMSSRTGASA
jgi:hypothetical protein